MKRAELVRHLGNHGCELFPEGGRHSIYWNPSNRKTTAVPRHVQILPSSTGSARTSAFRAPLSSATAGLLLAAAFAIGLAACLPAPEPPVVARHVVVVTIDTLRADRLGCYGRRDVATPRLDRLAAEGALAVEASAHVPLTRPSHVSIFTGLLPPEHGIRDNVSPAVVPKVPLLAERFHEAGFATGAFVSSVVLDSQSGLDRGFDVYADRFEGERGDAQFLNTVQKKGEDTIAEAVGWLRGQAGKRVFSGSTSTSRPSPTPPATRGRPTTAKWPGPTSSSAASTTRLPRSGCVTRRSSS